jgi:hypothetical protein
MANNRSTAIALKITSAAQRAIERQWHTTEPPIIEECYDSIRSIVHTHLSRISHFKAYHHRMEFQEYFKLGQILNQNPETTKESWIAECQLSYSQITIAKRIHKLFRDDESALAHLRGVTPTDFELVRRHHWETVMQQIAQYKTIQTVEAWEFE